MRRLPFLTTPGAWVRTGSRITDTARDAIAIERSKPHGSSAANVCLAVVIGIAVAALLAHWSAQ